MKFSRNVCLLVPVGLACTALVLLQLNAEPRANISNKQPLPELLPREKEIALAVSASPEHLRKGAGVYVLERNGFVKVRDSTNGFTCIVNRDHPLNWKPVCFDAEGTATILPKILRVGELLRQGKPMSKIDAEIAERFRTGKYISPRRPGVAYMLSGDIRNFNPRTGKSSRFRRMSCFTHQTSLMLIWAQRLRHWRVTLRCRSSLIKDRTVLLSC
jgi:hypothetical protein